MQSDAGAQALQELVFGYCEPNEQVSVHFARVRQANGAVANAAADGTKNVSIALATDAPAYSAAKEKHIAVPALHPGDILEYEIATRLIIPFAPHEFWFQQDFIDNAVVLDEELKIDVPQGRAVIVQSPNFQRETTQSNGRAIYFWKHVNPIAHPDNDPSSPEALARAAKIPDVQLTSFASWQAVAGWFASLERGRTDPTPEITAKAQQLVAGRTTEAAKVQAVSYDYYVSETSLYVRTSRLAARAISRTPQLRFSPISTPMQRMNKFSSPRCFAPPALIPAQL